MSEETDVLVYSWVDGEGIGKAPWWYLHCTHRSHAVVVYSESGMYGCWKVLWENEGVAVLQLTCMAENRDNDVHILVHREGLGSICTTRSLNWWQEIERPDFNKFIQGQMQSLKSVLS